MWPFEAVSVKNLFSITALSTVLFFILNVRIQTTFDDNNVQSLQLIIEFASPFDTAPIQIDPNEDQPSNPQITESSTPPENVTTTTPRPTFTNLLKAIPHECIMEANCHLYLSESPQFMKKSIVIIGMVRDAEKDIIATLLQLDQISCIFKSIVFIFYESNSKDNTPYIMEEWTHMYLDGEHCHHFKYDPDKKDVEFSADLGIHLFHTLKITDFHYFQSRDKIQK